MPQLIFPFAGFNSPACKLFTLKRNAVLSVVPINWPAGLIPLFPVKLHASDVLPAIGCQLGVVGFPVFTISWLVKVSKTSNPFAGPAIDNKVVVFILGI